MRGLVEEKYVRGIDRCGRDADSRRLGARRIERRALDADGAVARHHQPEPLRLTSSFDRAFERISDGARVEGVFEVRSRPPHAGEMAIEQKKSVGRRPSNRLEQIELLRAPLEDRRLQETLLILVRRVGIPHDDAADAVDQLSSRDIHHSRADGDAELRGAVDCAETVDVICQIVG